MKYKVKKNDNFEVLPRATLQDSRLKMEELGLLVRLISYPQGWELRVDHIKKISGWGRDKTRDVLRRLVQLGYIKRYYKNGKNGTFNWFAEIYPEAQMPQPEENKEENENQEPSPENTGMADSPCDGPPCDDPPRDGEDGHLKSTQLNNTYLKNKEITPPPEAPEPKHEGDQGSGGECDPEKAGDKEIEEYLSYCKRQARERGVKDVAGWVKSAGDRIKIKQEGIFNELDLHQLKQWRELYQQGQGHEDMQQYAQAGEDII
jgi:hypothetical protein